MLALSDSTRGRRLLTARPILVLIAVLVAAWLSMASSAPAALAYPQQTGTLQVAAGTLAPGATVTLTGNGFAPGASVSVYVYSSPTLLATTHADATGGIDVTVTLPSDLAPGTHTVQAVGAAPDGGTTVLSVSFTVAGSSSPLSITGFPAFTSAILGVLLLGIGALVLVVVRRRRQA